MILFNIAISLLFHLQPSHQTKILELGDYEWKNRIVLVFADRDSKHLLKKQVDHLLTDRSGLIDRNLLVFSITENEKIKEVVHGDLFEADKEVNLEFNKQAEEFYLVLIGKDGGVKYRGATFLEREKLYAIIDAMPMRQSEMRRSISGN